MDFLQRMRVLSGVDGPDSWPDEAEEGWWFYGWHTLPSTELVSCVDDDGVSYQGKWHPEKKAWVLYAPYAKYSKFSTRWNTPLPDTDAVEYHAFWRWTLTNPFRFPTTVVEDGDD